MDGQPGVVQVFSTGEGEPPVRVKTVTTAKGNCQFDFILAAATNVEELEADFDRWWKDVSLRVEDPSK